MGIDQEEFTRAFLVALKCPEVQEALSDVVAQRLKNEIVQLRGELRNREDALQKLQEETKELREENDRLEQYTRRNSIRITNMPEKKNEDVTEAVLNLVNNELSLSPPLEISEIDRMHRVGKMQSVVAPGNSEDSKKADSKKTAKPRAILVKFATYRSRKTRRE